MMCMDDYEINPPTYEKYIEKPNVYVLIIARKMDSCIYFKLFNLM